MKQTKKLTVNTIEHQFNVAIKKANAELFDLEKAVADKKQQIKALEIAKTSCMENE